MMNTYQCRIDFRDAYAVGVLHQPMLVHILYKGNVIHEKRSLLKIKSKKETHLVHFEEFIAWDIQDQMHVYKMGKAIITGESEI